MPTRTSKPCSQPGCPKLIKAGNTYCDEHKKADKSRKAERDKQYNKQREPKLRKFYSSSRWRKVRNRYIRKHPLCEHCEQDGRTKVAEVVDHIVPVKVEWSKRYDVDNFQSLCNRCHRRKTERDKVKYNL